MKLLIKVDEVTIGPFFYTAYIFAHKDEKVGFGIFLEGFKNPMIAFEALDDQNVRVSVSESQVRFIGEQSKSDQKSRLGFYQDFMDFVKRSEHVASKQIFPRKKMEYLTDYRNLSKMRDIYLTK